MYPNQPQQNLGFYVPPPMVFSVMPNQMNNNNMFHNNQGNNMADMLNDVMSSRPNFSADIFGTQPYKSKFMWWIPNIINHEPMYKIIVGKK